MYTAPDWNPLSTSKRAPTTILSFPTATEFAKSSLVVASEVIIISLVPSKS